MTKQAGHFYDLHAPNLEYQAIDVVGSRDELYGSLESAAGRLARQPRYTAQFRQAFPDTEAGAPLVSPVRIQKALAAYERSLVRLKAFLVTLTDTARRP